ncbi:hypothetical protein D3C71_2240920 [compost metagenome]
MSPPDVATAAISGITGMAGSSVGRPNMPNMRPQLSSHVRCMAAPCSSMAVA